LQSIIRCVCFMFLFCSEITRSLLQIARISLKSYYKLIKCHIDPNLLRLKFWFRQYSVSLSSAFCSLTSPIGTINKLGQSLAIGIRRIGGLLKIMCWWWYHQQSQWQLHSRSWSWQRRTKGIDGDCGCKRQ